MTSVAIQLLIQNRKSWLVTDDTLNISLLIATADRPDELAVTLRGLARCQLPDVDIEVIVADNGVDEGTATVCREADARLNIRHLAVAERGKTIALNQAVEIAVGDLLVFTDDDVEFDSSWLIELWRAAQNDPAHVLFGGRVTPIWPDGIPARLDGSAYLGPLYTHLDCGDKAGPIAGFRPFGPSMAVRRSVFDRGLRFDRNLGPGSTSGITMGDETEIARQLEAMGLMAVYVPRSIAYHRVQHGQLSLRWQLQRGVTYGRLLAHIEGPGTSTRYLGVPGWIYRNAVSGLIAAVASVAIGRRRQAFDELMGVAVSVGRAKAGGGA